MTSLEVKALEALNLLVANCLFVDSSIVTEITCDSVTRTCGKDGSKCKSQVGAVQEATQMTGAEERGRTCDPDPRRDDRKAEEPYSLNPQTPINPEPLRTP